MLEDGTVFTSLVETNIIQAWNKMHRVRHYTLTESANILQMIVNAQFIFCLTNNKSITVFSTQTTQVTKILKFDA